MRLIVWRIFMLFYSTWEQRSEGGEFQASMGYMRDHVSTKTLSPKIAILSSHPNTLTEMLPGLFASSIDWVFLLFVFTCLDKINFSCLIHITAWEQWSYMGHCNDMNGDLLKDRSPPILKNIWMWSYLEKKFRRYHEDSWASPGLYR